MNQLEKTMCNLTIRFIILRNGIYNSQFMSRESE